jgi:hypothetical protein
LNRSETYYLPSGRAVAILADVSLGAPTISFQLADGTVVEATTTSPTKTAPPVPTFAGFLASCVADCVES